MLFKKSLKSSLEKIIVQGNNEGIQKLFDDIVEATIEEFREDNFPTLSSFLVEHLYRAFERIDKKAAVSSIRAMVDILENMNKN